MGGAEDVEHGTPPHSPGLPPIPNMLGRGMGEARRRITVLLLLGAILIMSLFAFRRQDEIGEIIETQKSHYFNSEGGASHLHNATEGLRDPSAAKGSKETLVEVGETHDEESVRSKDGKGKARVGSGWGRWGRKGKGKTAEDEEEARKNATKSVVAPGPTFGERKLQDESLVQLRNETLGVRTSLTCGTKFVADSIAVRSDLRA